MTDASAMGTTSRRYVQPVMSQVGCLICEKRLPRTSADAKRERPVARRSCIRGPDESQLFELDRKGAFFASLKVIGKLSRLSY